GVGWCRLSEKKTKKEPMHLKGAMHRLISIRMMLRRSLNNAESASSSLAASLSNTQRVSASESIYVAPRR
ncbi:MAG: hypothetical protein ACR2RE_10065, partial [Geminicoccaceae bacterium]